ncbi:DUF484 family protein [Allopusillimonas soli]|uniref:DUF484 family protein n=1 Tax=Allopusillimonas soli TaxID=659016 RepID=A0A853FH08_9BURK|nr:DUF484 family protein [Allopusillimonas soli]NYT38080.1 DUF484 family protein [Allopusillimonas soli]TEA73961.1 DUF484 family protein [Allopusillimonas soli]
MNAESLSAEDIALFLQENPSFFTDHADLFANLRVPHPNETRAISLGERQILTLRARAKDLEWRLSGLVHNASGNEKISSTLTDWCGRMLAEDDAAQIPGHIVRSLSDIFDLPAIALRLWDLPRLGESEFAQDVTPEIRTYARNLIEPYCGPLNDHEAAGWLGTPPASLAIVALRRSSADEPIGLLVLGSDDPERFTPDMGTVFLDTINRLASASLSRLQQPAGA